MNNQSNLSTGQAQDENSNFVTYGGKQYKITTEGAAEILELQRDEETEASKKGDTKSQSVFYNPVQQYNRDLSVLAIKVFGDDLAAIRKARHKRRLDQLAKGGQRGKKRKELHDENLDGGAVIGFDEPRTNADFVDGKERPIGTHAEPEEPSTGHELLPPTNLDDKKTTVEENANKEAEDRNTKSAEKIPTGPKHGMDDRMPPPKDSFRILDALSATGLRALRYAKEIPMVTSVVANDLSSSATNSIRLNTEHNKVADKVIPNKSDAVEHMHFAASQGQRTQNLYQVVDLDPYGTAAPFLDAAVQAVVDGGLLCVTCTDSGVFASVGFLEKTYSQYGGLPLKGAHAHEGGLRLILHAIATAAARYGLAIEPLLSLSIDFYARIFIRVRKSPMEVKFLASKTMAVYSCDTGCGAWKVQHLARAKSKEARNGDKVYSFTAALAPNTDANCEHCGFKTHQAGPMWGGPLHNPHFIQRILDALPGLDKSVYGTIPRIEGMLSVALSESLEDNTAATATNKTKPLDRPIPPLDPAVRSSHPFFFLPSALSKILHCVSPSDAAVRGALLHLGYRVTRSHTKAGSICTDAPWSVLWEIMREWIRQKSPVKEEAMKARTAGWGIMQKDRSRPRLNQAREAFRRIADDTNLETIDELRRDAEAILYRLSTSTEWSKDEHRMKTTESSDCLPPNNDKENQDRETGVDKQSIENASDRQPGTQDNPSGRGATPPRKLKIVFDEALGREPQEKRIVRYQANPRADWGPMHRAKGS